MKKFSLRIVVAIFALIVFGLPVEAQFRAETFAITNARIVVGTGAVNERGTIVIRNGLIEAIGDNVRVPADARVIDGTGLTVYPGLINAYTSLGIPTRPTTTPGGTGQAPAQVFAQLQQQQQAQQQQSNSNYPVGLQPEVTVFEQLRAGDAQFDSVRSFGFTTALTVSRDGVFNGQSALINLAGETVSEMVVASPVAQHFTFRTIGGGRFPVSLMGTFAAFRQMMLDAQRMQQIQKMYDANPRGIRRPEADKSLEALLPVLNRQVPMVFNANTEREIIRVIDLAREFNIRAIIAGGQDAWKVTDRLKAANIPVLLSLNFPRRTTATSPDADPENLSLMRMRAETPKGAGRLAAAGIKFAFQDGGMTNLNEYLANVNRAIENGLARDAAIRAMALNAAEIFGVDNRMGSLERGKIANIVVSRGDLLARDKTITHVFVDGKLFEPKPPAQTPAGRPGAQPGATPGTTPGTPPAFANVAGTWNLSFEIQGQQFNSTLNLAQSARILTGTMLFQNTTVQIKDGEVTSDGFRFAATVEFAGTEIPLTVVGKVAGNQITGTFNAPQGVFPFTGTRTP
jgi:imidazolonepropionase-like amidohydrolase